MNLAVVSVVLLLHNYALAYDSIDLLDELCQKDSVRVKGICKCDYSLCRKPPCVTTLVQVTNYTDTPGKCCPTYSCDDCSEESRIDGKCPCLPGATIRSGRKCECVDPHHSIINDTCVCDPNRCELPDLCDDRSVSVKIVDGCCEKVKCIPCPDDSFRTDYNDLGIEDKCVCFPCLPTKCNETQRPEILRKGRNVPDMCCDIYKCKDIESTNQECAVNGTVYVEGNTWKSKDLECKCQNGVAHCSLVDTGNTNRSCLSDGKVYHHLDTWVEDACTNCTCKNGKPKCIAHMCDVYTSEVKKPSNICNTAMINCKKVCENGYKLNRQGCEVCKCKSKDGVQLYRDKYVYLDDLLNEHNLTEEDVVILVKKFVRRGERIVDLSEGGSGVVTASALPTTTTTTTTSTATPSTTVCITDSKNIRGDCTYSCILQCAIPGFVVGAIFGGILLFSFLKCSEKNRQKYKMAYNYKPVGKETVDKNLNFSPIIKSKNFELQSYNEKKNVI